MWGKTAAVGKNSCGTMRAMRIGCVLIAVMMFATFASAAEPATRPTQSRRIAAMSMREAEDAMGLLGPVRVANYSRTFAPPKSDPHQQYRDRYMYGAQSYSPYLFYGCGFPYYGFYGNGCYGSYGCGPGSWIAPASIFYGD